MTFDVRSVLEVAGLVALLLVSAGAAAFTQLVDAGGEL